MLRIQEVCKEKGLTMQDLSKRLDISYQAMYASISGNPTLERLQQIATALEVDITDLFEKKGDIRIFVEYQGGKHEITTRDIIRLIEEPKIPDHENIRGAEYYK